MLTERDKIVLPALITMLLLSVGSIFALIWLMLFNVIEFDFDVVASFIFFSIMMLISISFVAPVEKKDKENNNV